MKIFETEAALELASLQAGQLVRTKGYENTQDGISTLWRIAASGDGVTLANGNVAIPYSDGTAQMRKNYIINGDMSFWQRGTYFDLNTAKYTADRWFSPSSRITARSSNVPPDQGFAFSLSNRRNNSNRGNANIQQAVELSVEGNASPFIKGKTYTLSGWINGQAGRQFFVTAGYADAVNLVSDDRILDGALISDNEPDWKKFKLTFTISVDPQPTNRCLNFIFYSELVEGVDIGFLLTGVQLEDGPVDTPFEFLQEQEKIALCQRYYQKRTTGPNGINLLSSAYRDPVSYRVINFQFPVKMRSAPTVGDVVDNGKWNGLAFLTSIDGCRATGTSDSIGSSASISQISFDAEL